MEDLDLQKWMQWNNGVDGEPLVMPPKPVTRADVEERFEIFRSNYESCYDRQPVGDTEGEKWNFETLFGTYSVFGHNPDDSLNAYDGSISIFWEAGHIRGVWEVGEGQYQFGKGFWHGGLLALDFCYAGLHKQFEGQVIYKAVSPGVLKGFWIDEEAFSPGFEELTRIDD